jgi:hypothetical protein
MKETFIERVRKLLEEHTEPFLVGGAALWGYRDKSLPGGQSRSFGIGVFGQDKFYKMKEVFAEENYTMTDILGSVIQIEGPIQIMIFFMTKDGDEWFSYRHHVGRYLSVPDRFHNLEQIEFNGWKVPSPIEDYLLWVYGSEWKDHNQINKSFPPTRQFK